MTGGGNNISNDDVLRMIRELRANSAIAGGGQVEGAQPANTTGADFSATLNKAINAVNDAQMESGALKKAFEVGDPNVDLPQVMVASQKAKVSFEAMLEVRNKLLEAYREVMRMQV